VHGPSRVRGERLVTLCRVHDRRGISGQAAAAKTTTSAGIAARVGLASRALVYGMLAGIVARVAAGANSDVGSDVDQGSSLQVLGRSFLGTVLLWTFVAAVLCYFLWRASEAWLGTADPGGHTRRARIQAGLEGACYLPFGWVAASVAAGHDRSARQGENYRGLAGSVMRHGIGRVAVGVVGVVVVGVGVFFVVQGVRRSFRGHFDWDAMPPWARHLTQISGAVGSVARGAIFVLAGSLVVVAAFTADASKAGGVDSALDALAMRPYGRWLLAVSAAGFAAFAVFAVCEAVWRRSGARDPLGAESLHGDEEDEDQPDPAGAER
jgi:hypothetical protein